MWALAPRGVHWDWVDQEMDERLENEDGDANPLAFDDHLLER